MGGSESKPRRDLKKHAASFIKKFDSSEHRMTQIVEEFRGITDEVRETQQTTDAFRTAGTFTAGVGIGLLVLAAPLTGGASLAAGAVGAAAAAGGGAVVAGANEKKTRKEIERKKKVEKLGKEFMKIVERMKNNLEKIKRRCEKLDQRSAQRQAEKTRADMEEFQRILRRVSEDRREGQIPHLADLCDRVVGDCEKMKKELKRFTEK
ncbi:uncharacterized protein LOC120545308 isoform X2 [Perca fluviatilis]|uniref:uncharacterized protein LOC120545308 isoform X2 n=1 Tax=Perca fluviatilis TaxID=8168 RepID=UPI001964D9A3|nr:uncharacterized protein LOC120545308 isoform X2 [Perca fluviatilis]XP_039635487.1 uncharacterized protein LOC120545308 isoform X2 [Perca fluviatilis]XP_039635488.1 uncharacterized protein LOC120545308 isoform X2 [Perca fluviatilis]